jgi:hypothetical protein
MMLSGTNDPGRKPEKENMAEFVAKKREVFLVQVRAVLCSVIAV